MNETRFARVEDKIDKLRDSIDLVRMEQIIHGYRLDEYNTHLEEHMRRTEALEKQVGPIYMAKMCVGTGSTIATILGVAYKIAKSLGYL